MNTRLVRPLVTALAALAALLAGGGSPALAHEERAAGDFQLVVGWGDEPAYTGFRNRAQVTVTDASGDPVADLGGSLQVEVTTGDDRITLPLEPAPGGDGSGAPGTYGAALVPTRPGSYTFRVMGTISGRSVDETFTSSPTTFDDVVDSGAIQFPAGDPSTGQLATRIDREVPRLEARAEEVEAGLAEAADRADRARTFGLVGLVAGALGLLTAAAALVTARRQGPRRGTAPGVGGRAVRSDRAGSLHQ